MKSFREFLQSESASTYTCSGCGHPLKDMSKRVAGGKADYYDYACDNSKCAYKGKVVVHGQYAK